MHDHSSCMPETDDHNKIYLTRQTFEFLLSAANILIENITLTHLVLRNCEISADGVAHLLPSLRHKPLQFLDLSDNTFSSKGADYIGMLDNHNSSEIYMTLVHGE